MSSRLLDCPHFATTLSTDCPCFAERMLQLAVDIAFLEQVGLFEESSDELAAGEEKEMTNIENELPLSREKDHNSGWEDGEPLRWADRKGSQELNQPTLRGHSTKDPQKGNAGVLPAPRMPYGRPLTPPASMLAPALRGAGNEPDTQPGSPTSDAGRGSRRLPISSVGHDRRRHVWRRGAQSPPARSRRPGAPYPGNRPGSGREGMGGRGGIGPSDAGHGQLPPSAADR